MPAAAFALDDVVLNVGRLGGRSAWPAGATPPGRVPVDGHAVPMPTAGEALGQPQATALRQPQLPCAVGGAADATLGVEQEAVEDLARTGATGALPSAAGRTRQAPRPFP